MAYNFGTKEKPLTLKTPPLSSEYTMHVDQKDGKDIKGCIKQYKKQLVTTKQDYSTAKQKIPVLRYSYLCIA